MGILKYHPTSLISYERGWALACLEDLIKPNQASHQGARWTSSVSILKVPVLALIIETSAVWPWYRRSFQDICRGLWIIIAALTCGFRMVYIPLMFFAQFAQSEIWWLGPKYSNVFIYFPILMMDYTTQLYSYVHRTWVVERRLLVDQVNPAREDWSDLGIFCFRMLGMCFDLGNTDFSLLLHSINLDGNTL
jgi:hypothetical protein